MNLGTSFCKHPSLFGRKIHLDVMPLVLKSDVCRHRILYPFLANNMPHRGKSEHILLNTLRCQTSEHPQQNFIPSYLMGNSPGSVRRYTSLLM